MSQFAWADLRQEGTEQVDVLVARDPGNAKMVMPWDFQKLWPLEALQIVQRNWVWPRASPRRALGETSLMCYCIFLKGTEKVYHVSVTAYFLCLSMYYNGHLVTQDFGAHMRKIEVEVAVKMEVRLGLL
jgi:hypothetical protein